MNIRPRSIVRDYLGPLSSMSLCLFFACIVRSEEKHPVPSEKAQTEASQLVMEVYRQEIAQARTLPQHADIAADMIKTASESQPGSTEQHALFKAAIEQATLAYDTVRIREGIGRLASVFDANKIELSTNAIEAMALSTPPTPLCEQIRDLTVTVLNEALLAEDFERASRLSKINIELARRIRSAPALKSAMEIPALIESIKSSHTLAQAAEATLLLDPQNQAASDVLGKYLCFGKEDWEKGLPYLLTGNNATLQKLAELELNPEPDSIRLADEWWTFSQGKDRMIMDSSRKRAAHWYQIAYPKLTGLSRKLAEQRLKEVQGTDGTSQADAPKLAQGDWVTIFPSEAFASRWKSNSGKLIDFRAPVLRLNSQPNEHTHCEYPANLQDVIVRAQLEIHAGENAFIELRKGVNRGCSFIANKSGEWGIGTIDAAGFTLRSGSHQRKSVGPLRGVISLQAASIGDKQTFWINGRKVAETSVGQARAPGAVAVGVFNAGDTSFTKIEVLWPTQEQVEQILGKTP